jgi:esterase/lipase superfamily enzyme
MIGPRGFRRFAPLLLLIVAGTGCSAYLAASPKIYTTGDRNPYADVAPELRTADVPILFATDRKAEEGSQESDRKYTYERDRAIAFGVCHVTFGINSSWDELVAASMASTRRNPVLLTLEKTDELGRVPETRYNYSRTSGTIVATPTEQESVELAERMLLQMVESRLAAATRKDIYLFVHGYANTFKDAAFTMAQVWHFLGREGVPFLYSWPAGSGGLLRGYTHDRESGEFTVFHLKQTLRLLARARGLRKIHVIAHSRGTDVFLTALREIFLQDGRRVEGDCFATRLGSVVLAAPDIDFDVLISRVVFEGLLFVPDRLTIYVSEGDRAIGISNWLFSSLKRLGQLRSADLPPDALERLRQYSHIEVIDARVSGYGSWGHDYFYANPAVSSDLIRLLRYGNEAGDPAERPLKREENSFWILDNDYPEVPRKK